jgi:lipoate-protein ligase A
VSGTPRWRLLLDGPAPAAHNMSVDEALLEACARPTLRLYGWAQPALSLGRRQLAADWLLRCARAGVEAVRRPTGGGAVLHQGDLTYALVAPFATPGVPDGMRECYAFVQEILLEALGRAGIGATAAAPTDRAERSELCFARSTGFEIAVATSKLVGSAQRRTGRAWLQHGSVRLRDDRALYRALTGEELPPPAPAMLALDAGRLARTIADTFGGRLVGGLEPGALTSLEHALATARRAERVRDPLAAPAVSLRSSAGSADTAA